MSRTQLQMLTRVDGPAFVEAARRSVALHRGWVEPPSTLESFHEYLHPHQQTCLRYGAWHDGELVGVANINAIIRGSFQNGCLGFYAFHPHQRRGHMRKALRELVARGFGEHGLHRLEANIQPNNVPSCALIEQLGFRLEARSPRFLRVAGTWRDHNRYALTVEEWELLDLRS